MIFHTGFFAMVFKGFWLPAPNIYNVLLIVKTNVFLSKDHGEISNFQNNLVADTRTLNLIKKYSIT